MDQLFGALPFIFFILFFLVLPALARRRRGEELEQAFAKIQRKRKSRILAIVHRQEPLGLLGIPVLKYIDLNDSEDVLEAVRTTPKDKPLEIILHTPGGLVLPALQIARAVKAHPGPTRVYVPHYAMSGGTLIALAADEIILNPHAVLGPIDPQIGGLPAASVIRVTHTKSPDAIAAQTLVLADIGRTTTTYFDNFAGWFGRRKKETSPAQVPAAAGFHPHPAAIPDRTPFTGFEPGPGARSFSYGPWDPKDLRRQLPPGPAADEIRPRRER